MRVSHSASAGWALTLCDSASRAEVGLVHYAGLPGLLRQLREELAPDAPAGRLVIGAQQLRPRRGCALTMGGTSGRGDHRLPRQRQDDAAGDGCCGTRRLRAPP